jgi:hypothetical protein
MNIPLVGYRLVGKPCLGDARLPERKHGFNVAQKTLVEVRLDFLKQATDHIVTDNLRDNYLFQTDPKTRLSLIRLQMLRLPILSAKLLGVKLGRAEASSRLRLAIQ